MKKFNVCLTCVGGGFIYDVVRALRDTPDFQVMVVGIDANSEAPGRLLCDKFFSVPNAESASEIDYIDSLLHIHRQCPLDVFIPLSETEAVIVAKHRQRLEAEGIALSVSDYSVVEILTDKGLLNQRLKDLGIDNGRFSLVDSVEDMVNASRQFNYPHQKFVIKPRKSRGSRGVLIVDGAEPEFRSLLPNRFCGTGNLAIISQLESSQKIKFTDLLALPYYGGEVYDVDCLVDQGQLVMCSTRLRQLKNPLSPSSTGHKVVKNKIIIEYAATLCEALRAHGSIDFDMVLSDLGQPILLDAGARFSGSVGASFVAGLNFPVQLIRLLKNIPFVNYTLKPDTILRPFTTMAVIPEVNEFDFL